MGDCKKSACVSTDPPPVDLGEVKMQGDKQSEMCLSLINQCLSELEVLVSELNAFNPDRPVIAIDQAFCHTCLLFFLFLFTSLHIDWLLGFYKFINHLLLRGFLPFVCVEWENWKRLILESLQQRIHLPSFRFICKSEASKDRVIMMKQI